MEDYMTRTLPAASSRMRPPSGFKPHQPQTASTSVASSTSSHQPQLNPPSYYSTFHMDQHSSSYYVQQNQTASVASRLRPQFYNPTTHSTSPVKYYNSGTCRPPPTGCYKLSSSSTTSAASAASLAASAVQVSSSNTSSSSSSSTGSPSGALVTMRRPQNCGNSATCNRRNAVYIKEVTPEAMSSAKPPLPNENVPKPPPRTRPKSWTSTLFNAMRNNHRSVTFQCVDEEENHRISTEMTSSSDLIVASDPTMPLAAASSSDGQKFYSLPRPPSNTRLVTRSRTPSPFRSMIKGLLVKGTKTKLNQPQRAASNLSTS